MTTGHLQGLVRGISFLPPPLFPDLGSQRLVNFAIKIQERPKDKEVT